MFQLVGSRRYSTKQLELHAAEVAWRQQASTQLLAGLDEYDDAIKTCACKRG
jgi:hypothetical protein